MCWSPIQLRSELCGMICSFRRSLSFPLKVSSPSSNALRNPGLVDVVHRVCGAPRAVSGSWWLSLADGVHPSCIGHWEATQARTVLSGQRPFLPFSLPPPPPPAATHSPEVVWAGPEEFVNLQGLLVQRSKWFGVSSVQISSPVTSLSGKFVQFSSGHGGQDTGVHRDTGTWNTHEKLPHFYEVAWKLNALYRYQLLEFCSQHFSTTTVVDTN